jgi:Transposase IS66 family
VITNGDVAYYFYRNSREGMFLRDLLGGYSGIVVTDFFTAYDSLDCRQQKCLIHLIREINDEMLKAPYDDELRNIGSRFSHLLRAIVNTIDDYGLKRRHLSKHKTPAASFIKWIANETFKGRPAQKLQNRLSKYGDRLFTFLDADDVAWNNNNAERAMKSFARYRRFSDGKFTEKSLQEYLAILTICQTCEYRDLNFLAVLLGQTWANKQSGLALDDSADSELLLPGYEEILKTPDQSDLVSPPTQDS